MENTIILKSTIVPRNDISTNWNIQKPILVRGELGLESDTNQIKIGDGLNNWDKLNYIISSIKNDDIDVIIGGDVPEPPVEPTDPSKLWVYGLKAPAESNWKQLFPGMYDSYWLPWKEEYGWPPLSSRQLRLKFVVCLNKIHWLYLGQYKQLHRLIQYA